MVVWPPSESIREHLSEIFLKSGYGKCRVIKDCAEMFIERPECYLLRLLHGQTTSTIIHLTFWFGITPTGSISSISYCYGGRASNKFITRDSRFYDFLKRDNEDRGFQVQEELLLHFCRLVQE